jgi:hypothetical protein
MAYYTSPSHAGIQAAVSVGIGCSFPVSILPEVAILPEHRVLKTKEWIPVVSPNTEVGGWLAAPNAEPRATRPRLARAAAGVSARLPIRASGHDPAEGLSKESPSAAHRTGLNTRKRQTLQRPRE